MVTTSAEEKHTQLSLVKIFYNIEFLWHLCEILYVDVTPGKHAIILPSCGTQMSLEENGLSALAGKTGMYRRMVRIRYNAIISI